jgi:dolichol-phosphate mannosyltransferase
VVDDGSPDGTAAHVQEQIAAAPERVSLIERTGKQGLGTAYVAGFERALSQGAEAVVQMDADFSHDPQYIPTMASLMSSGECDLVIGSRYVAHGSLDSDWGLHRRLLSRWANFYVSALLGLRLRDATAGFKMWKAEFLRSISLDTVASQGYSFQVEMNFRARRLGARIVEIPIHFEDRKQGKSKMTLATQLESAYLPWALRFGQSKRSPRS